MNMLEVGCSLITMKLSCISLIINPPHSIPNVCKTSNKIIQLNLLKINFLILFCKFSTNNFLKFRFLLLVMNLLAQNAPLQLIIIFDQYLMIQ